ncbi:DUF7288 family protein [Halopelagius longus]|uniref:Uncharacterized protein n=1 Tax=Halopelagius longus TaxID=1236180 RepID=A0A1H1BK76_9EURY|nr:hypothetical protein [Halopelagius longus]RDI70817.1 hypothetical protein DWB78_03230 [Halopelagius longus]SDQ52307.1 hypothetical protein SAMN05216278_1834 [Halopelagius longus]
MTDRRAQAHTLEALAAGILLLSSLVFALQVTAVTPLTGSTSSQHIENQQASIADGILASEAENGTLKPTTLYWNASGSNWHGATSDGYPLGGPPTPFGAVLNETLADRGIAFNVNVYYMRSDERRRVRMVYLGQPSDHASVATRTVTLYDDDVLLDANRNPSGTAVSETTEFYAPDVSPDSPLYNVVEVEVVAWRM